MPTDENERNQAAWLTLPKGYPLEVLGRLSIFISKVMWDFLT